MIAKGVWIALVAVSVWANGGESVANSRSPYAAMNPQTAPMAFEGNAKTWSGPHMLEVRVNAYRSGDVGEIFKDKRSCEVNYDYQLCPAVSLNYLLGYREERFGGYDYRTYAKPGMEVRLVDDPEHKLDLQANILYARDKPDSLPETDYLSSRFGGIYRWNMEDNLRFIQEALYHVNLQETQYSTFRSKSAVETKINATLSMGVSYRIDYIATPSPLPERFDRTVLASVSIDY